MQFLKASRVAGCSLSQKPCRRQHLKYWCVSKQLNIGQSLRTVASQLNPTTRFLVVMFLSILLNASALSLLGQVRKRRRILYTSNILFSFFFFSSYVSVFSNASDKVATPQLTTVWLADNSDRL